MNSLIKLLIIFAWAGSGIVSACAQPDLGSQSDGPCISYIPAAISPNGDGINDLFTIQYGCELDRYLLRIYDSSDRIVYESQEAHATWDGSVQSEPQPQGYYTWELTFQDPDTGQTITQQGEFALVR